MSAFVPDAVAHLTPSRPDSEIARELKSRLELAYEPIISIFNEASGYNFSISCNLGRNNFGRFVLQVSITKELL